MARYCSMVHYKKILSTLNNSKDKCLKDLKLTKDGILTSFSPNDRLFSRGFLAKVIVQISKISSELQGTSKVLSAIPNGVTENKTTNKYIKTKPLKKEIHKLNVRLQKEFSKNRNVLWTTAGVAVVESTTQPDLKSIVEPVLDPIPEPPLIPKEIPDEIVNQLNALGEPTFASLGLGGSSPVGWVETAFEYLHVEMGLSWWAAIALGTLVIRLCLFPLVIIAQRNAAKMNNYLPQMQAIQMKMTEARQTGNQLDAARYAQELMLFMREKGVNPIKNMIVPLAQMPVFISVFMGLRGMANMPVESLRTGGMLWFLDLTIPDQYYLLPIITSATLYATLELGTDSAKMSSQNAFIMKYVLKGLPLVILPFTINFPGAILCYWVSTNFISLIQVGFLRIPRVRQYFDIEAMQSFDPSTLPMKQKGFVEGMKESWTNMKITKELEERRRLDEIRFQQAGKGPVIKTFKYDPTKQTEPISPSSISAKKH